MLKIWDGYDHYNDTTDWLARSGFLQYMLPATNASPVSFVTGRNGLQKALQLAVNFTYTSWVFQDRNASAFIGQACIFPAGAGQGFEFRDSVGSGTVNSIHGGTLTTSVQCSVYFNSDNYSIAVFKGPIQVDVSGIPGGSTLLYTSGNNVWTGDVWNYIQVWANIDDLTGFVKVYVNDVLLVNLTAVSTKVTGNSWWDILDQAGTAEHYGFGVTLTIDDFYYGDTVAGAGTFPADAPIGDCRVDTLFAIGNNAVQFTPLANANWQEISEIAMDSDASYNFDGTVGQEDSFNYASLPSGITAIYGVQVTGAYRKDDSGARSVKQTLISGGTQQYGSVYAAGTNYQYYTDQWILDPHTGLNWTVLGVNALKAGYNVAA